MALTKSTKSFTVTKTIVIGNLVKPTFDFYFKQRLNEAKGDLYFSEHEVLEETFDYHQLAHVRIILLGNVSIRLLLLLNRLRLNSEIILFIDDNIPAAITGITLPSHYKRKLKKWYETAKQFLLSLYDDVWVSMPYLAKRYGLSDSYVLYPPQVIENKQTLIKCFYHGSVSHAQEWQLLAKLISDIQNRYNHVYFELIGDHKLNKAFKALPWVSVLHRISWQNYKAHITTRPMYIAFVPLFDSTFIRARSHTKLFDIVRQGAIGLYGYRFSQVDKVEAYMACGPIYTAEYFRID